MKKILIILLFPFVISFSQFKGDDGKPLNIRGGLLNDNPMTSLFSFLEPSNFSMSHSFGMSYSSFGNDGMALGVYTNHLSYKFSEELNIEVDASLINSPYNSLGDSFTKSINGVYLDRARINYQPSKDFNISVQLSNSPFVNNYRYGRRGFSPFSNFMYD